MSTRKMKVFPRLFIPSRINTYGEIFVFDYGTGSDHSMTGGSLEPRKTDAFIVI